MFFRVSAPLVMCCAAPILALTAFDAAARISGEPLPSKPLASSAATPQQMQPTTGANVVAQPLSGDSFVRAALSIGQSLAANGSAQIYDNASAVMKRTLSKADFMKAVAANNARYGATVSREWGRIERLRVTPPAPGAASRVPPGNYVTVFVIARGANGVEHVEQVSFRLDEDNSWRVAGVTTQ